MVCRLNGAQVLSRVYWLQVCPNTVQRRRQDLERILDLPIKQLRDTPLSYILSSKYTAVLIAHRYHSLFGSKAIFLVHIYLIHPKINHSLPFPVLEDYVPCLLKNFGNHSSYTSPGMP